MGHLPKPLAILSVAFVALIGCAAPPAQATQDPVRSATIAHACKDIMGFYPGETLYESCVLSLKQTMASVDEAAGVQARREACGNEGLIPGTPAFARCVVKSSQTATSN